MLISLEWRCSAVQGAHLNPSSSDKLMPYPISPHLTSPHLTSPHLTSPHLTSPHLTSPHLTSPHLTSPHLTSPHLTSPHLTSPHLTYHSPPPLHEVHFQNARDGIGRVWYSIDIHVITHHHRHRHHHRHLFVSQVPSSWSSSHVCEPSTLRIHYPHDYHHYPY